MRKGRRVSDPKPCPSQVLGSDRLMKQKVEAAGIERTAQSLEPITVPDFTPTEPMLSALCLHGEGTTSRKLASPDTALHRIVALWPSLSSNVKQAVLEMCVDAKRSIEY